MSLLRVISDGYLSEDGNINLLSIYSNGWLITVTETIVDVEPIIKDKGISAGKQKSSKLKEIKKKKLITIKLNLDGEDEITKSITLNDINLKVINVELDNNNIQITVKNPNLIDSERNIIIKMK